jgi:hypothetical protein
MEDGKSQAHFAIGQKGPHSLGFLDFGQQTPYLPANPLANPPNY